MKRLNFTVSYTKVELQQTNVKRDVELPKQTTYSSEAGTTFDTVYFHEEMRFRNKYTNFERKLLKLAYFTGQG